ncbi:MAG: hypothetical protein GX957_00655 [Clostridiaceae bacterium]|nr:hypothetical protein [Clostridiaceae bacterium]
MKKKLLICSLSVMLLVVGVLVAQGVTQKQTEGQGSTENLLNNANEISKVTEVVLTEEIGNNSAYPSGDLLYREFSQGCELEKGTEVFIEKEQVANVLDNAMAIGIVLNGEVYKELSFEDADIQVKLEESGNYVFMAVNEEGETVDVTFTIRAEKSADGGVILLK